jgi:glycosyltransferase involved in cell wall biosynthesis
MPRAWPMDHIPGLANRPHSDRMPPETLRIAFATPQFVTERHFDGGLANYLNRVSCMLADAGHDVHVVTLSSEGEADFDHAGVRVHRVMLGSDWQWVNWLTRYRLSTTCYWLNLSSRMYRKLRELHHRHPFHIIQYPNYSFCGLFFIPLLRAAHVVRASSYEPAWNDAAGLTRNLDVALAEKLEVLQYKLARHVYAPSQALQTMLAEKAAMPRVHVIRTPSSVETRDWDTSVYDQCLAGKRYVLYFGRFQLHKGVHIFARALPRFLERHPDAHAVFVGRDMETPLSSSMAAFARTECGMSASRRHDREPAASAVVSNHRLRPIGGAAVVGRQPAQCLPRSHGARDGGDRDHGYEFRRIDHGRREWVSRSSE